MLLDLGVLNGLSAFMSNKNSLLGPTMKMASSVSLGCLALAGIFFLIMTALNVIKMLIGEGKQNFNFLWKYFALMLTLTLYTTLMPVVDLIINVPINIVKNAASGISNGGQNTAKLNSIINKSNEKAAAPAAAPTPGDVTLGGTTPTSLFSALDPRNWAKAVVTGVIETLYTIVQGVIVFVQVFSIAILYVSGPIAISFSILVGFEGGLLGWLKYYIVIKLWTVIVYIIQGLSTLLILNSLDPGSGMPSWEALVVQAGLVLIYCMVPKFADILISGSQGGSFFSAAVGAGTMGLKSLASPVQNAAASYAGGKNIGKFGDAASNVFKRLGQKHGTPSVAKAAPGFGGEKVD